MKTLFFTVLASALTWPLASHADGLDIPALGIHVAEMPANSKAPEVTRRPEGELALLPFGTVTLVVARAESPAPAESAVRDSKLHALELQASLDQDPGSTVHQGATMVGGHDAWTILTLHQADLDRTIDYSFDTYVIVDQHLYRFLVSTNAGRKAPPDFLAAVNAVSNLTFRPIEPSSAPLTAPLDGNKPVLEMRGPHDRTFYPAPAQRRGDQGVVDLEYRIDSKGRPRSVRELYSTSSTLAAAAQQFLAALSANVDRTWSARGNDKRVFDIEVQFWLAGLGQTCPDIPSAIPGTNVVRICVRKGGNSFPLHIP